MGRAGKREKSAMIATGSINKQVLKVLKAPSAGRPFLAGIDTAERGGKQTLTVHAASTAMSGKQSRRLSADLRAKMPQTRVRVKRHPARTLARARSLENFLRPFAHDQLIFDPSGVFDRGAMLVQLVHGARELYGALIKKCLWHSPTGTLFVILDYSGLAAKPGEAAVKTSIESSLREAVSDDPRKRFIKSVRLGFHEPALATVPVDAASLEVQDTVFGRFSKNVYMASVVTALGIGASTARANEGNQAVSAPNGEIAIMGGTLDDESAFFAEAAVTAPAGEQHGFRLDGVAGTVDGEFVGGAGAHFFWRNPDVGLFGVAAGYLNAEANGPLGNDQEFGVVAAEGEVYQDQITISGLAGYQFSNSSSDDGFIARADVEWYPDDDVMLTVGVETNPSHDTLGRMGVEFRPSIEALPGLSFFAEGAIGDDDYSRAFAGIRFYFGEGATLKDKHRRDTFRSHLLPTRMLDGIDHQSLAYGE